ncbi:EAL domain-containing protein [Massilia arenosa]|uniref:EAL domain-containing protein n=1 Tax=Zemynaea arenosa TaxID=2561931 RepID=A0A4Y9SFN3_9BURK|nr:EAL domain-containing protein [Massilia arenosa]TFW22451.1 EAL domain-containing protein [Massilia arenosa]
MIPILEQYSPRTACKGCGEANAIDFDFEYAYQPIVQVSTRSIYAHEALVRGPNGEPAPTVLSKVNKDNIYHFDQACRVKAVEGAARLGMRERLSINFLPNAVYRPEVCIRTTLEAARRTGFPVENIIFEVTESEQVTDRAHLVGIFREYDRLGFHTAIDDFGAGYAGLNLLAEYQPHIVKLDMDLVRNIDTSAARQAIVRHTVALCRDLGVTVLAEGVETSAERDVLIAAGIDLLQGYLFSKPIFNGLATIPDAAWA